MDRALERRPDLGILQMTNHKRAAQGQAARLELCAQCVRLGREVPEGTQLDGVIPGLDHLVQETLRGRLARVIGEPHAP